MWQKLEEQNPDFFRAYYTRLKIKDQIILFNQLIEQHAQLLQKVNHTSVQGKPPNLQKGTPLDTRKSNGFEPFHFNGPHISVNVVQLNPFVSANGLSNRTFFSKATVSLKTTDCSNSVSTFATISSKLTYRRLPLTRPCEWVWCNVTPHPLLRYK